MYKILNSVVAIVIVGAISTQICGMEEKQRENGQEKRAADLVAPLTDGAAKRQRVAQELQARGAAAVSNAPEIQIFKEGRDDNTEVPMCPVITNSLILEELERLSSHVNVRFEELQTILRDKFAEEDTRLRDLHYAVALLQRAPFGPVGVSNTDGPVRAQPKQGRLQVPVRLAPPAGLIASNAEALAHNIAAMRAAAVAQAISYPAAIPKQNPAPNRSCTYTPIKDFLAHDGPVNYVKHHKDGYGNQGKNCMVSASSTCIKLWNDDGKIEALMQYPGLITYVKCNSIYGTDIFFTVGLADNTIRELSTKGADNGVLRGHVGKINSVCDFYPGGGYTRVSASSDTTIKIWHPDGSLIRTIMGHKGPVNALAILCLERERFIVSASADKTSRIWDFEGHEVGKLPDFTSPVTCLTTVGEYIVAGSFDGTVFLWNKRHGYGYPFKIPINEGMHSVKGFFHDQTHILIATASPSKIMFWLIGLKHNAANTLMHTISSEGSDIQSIDLWYDAKDKYILTYGMSNGRIKKGMIKIS